MAHTSASRRSGDGPSPGIQVQSWSSRSGMGWAWKTSPSSYMSAGLEARISLASLAHTARMGRPASTESMFAFSSALPPALRSIRIKSASISWYACTTRLGPT